MTRTADDCRARLERLRELHEADGVLDGMRHASVEAMVEFLLAVGVDPETLRLFGGENGEYSIMVRDGVRKRTLEVSPAGLGFVDYDGAAQTLRLVGVDREEQAAS